MTSQKRTDLKILSYYNSYFRRFIEGALVQLLDFRNSRICLCSSGVRLEIMRMCCITTSHF